MRAFSSIGPSLRRLPMRRQLMWAFATLSIGTTAITALTVASFTSHRMHLNLRDKSVQYARQLQRQLEPVIAFDDHVTAQEAFESLKGDRDLDGLGVYKEDGRLIEGRGIQRDALPSINAHIDSDPQHVIAVAEILSREGRRGRVYVKLNSRSIDEMATAMPCSPRQSPPRWRSVR